MTRILPALLLLVACSPPSTDDDVSGDSTVEDSGVPAEFAFYTPAWADGEAIPVEYTCDGAGGWPAQDNPQLVWENPPEGTEAFAVIYVDTDLGDWEHWAFYTANAEVLEIPRTTSNTSNLPVGVVELESQDSRTGYVPNCPGPTPHSYEFTIWAVSDANALVGSATFTELEANATANSLGTLSFSGMASTN